MRTLSLILILIPGNCLAQTVTPAQQKAMNSIVAYANQSAEEVTAVFSSIKDYYPKIHQKNNWGPPRYTCPVQLDEYYYNTMLGQTKNLPAQSVTMINATKALRAIAEKIDRECKSLDTYHKLEDYKQDNFAKAETIIVSLQSLLAEYVKQQQALDQTLRTSWKKISASETAYSKADQFLLARMDIEKAWLKQNTFNLNESVPTPWAVDVLEKSILETAAGLKKTDETSYALKYPASSMWSNFKEGLADILEAKRNALNGYNHEAQKTDEHSNQAYLDLINYYNGILVSDYNMFIQYAQNDGYLGLASIKYVPTFEIKQAVHQESASIKPFQDIKTEPLIVAKQSIIIPPQTYHALTNYIDFINETWRQTNYLQAVISNFSSSAAYYKGLTSFEKRGAMSFDFKDYQLPLAEYQKAVTESKSLPPSTIKTLNAEAEVLLNILKEMNDQCSVLEIEVTEKRYEKDHLEKVYSILERLKELFLIWDDRKEKLYDDARLVYDAYLPPPKTKSWYVSGNSLYELSRLDHQVLFQAKAHYRGNTVASISTEAIDAKVREVIANEYENMKGIQKLGRYNGRCPYTPYEDLPEASKYLSELVKKLAPVTNSSRYNHPYYRMMYQYNLVADQYNKFCELSKDVLLLKTVKQPEWFELKYPQPKTETTQPSKPVEQTVVVIAAEKPTATTPQPTETVKPEARHSVTQEKLVKHDTVVIIKRDTVYLHEDDENLRSMEGYATNNLILVLDVSGSMNAADKLPLLKQSVLNLLSMMRTEDEVGIVVFSDKPKVLLSPVSFKDEEKIKSAIDKLKSSGKTDGNAALKLAYKVADENYIRGGNNRIVLATDGEFAVSEETIKLIETFSTQDIFLTIFNFGKGMGASKALEQLSKTGKGNYESISKENVELNLIREVKAKKKK